MYNAADDGTSENRKRIFKCIQNDPGVHLRKICKDLELGMGDTQYHLNWLEKSGQIKSRRINLHRHYYSVALPEKDEVIIAFLRKETARDILIYLIENPGSTQSDIVNFKHFSAPTISWHMSRLIDSGIIIGKREGKVTRYFIQRDSKVIIDSLKVYYPNIWNKLSDRFAELFLELASREKEEEDNDDAV